jgi:hypothetical protein
MKTAVVGFLLIVFSIKMMNPSIDAHNYWVLMGVGMGLIIGRALGSLSRM